MKTNKILLPVVLLLLVLLILGLFINNQYLRKQNMILVDNFNLLVRKIEALESEMKVKRVPPISPEKIFVQKGYQTQSFSSGCNKKGNRGYLLKGGQASSAD